MASAISLVSHLTPSLALRIVVRPVTQCVPPSVSPVILIRWRIELNIKPLYLVIHASDSVCNDPTLCCHDLPPDQRIAQESAFLPVLVLVYIFPIRWRWTVRTAHLCLQLPNRQFQPCHLHLQGLHVPRHRRTHGILGSRSFCNHA